MKTRFTLRGIPSGDSGLTLKEIVSRVGEAGCLVKGFDSMQKGIVLMEKNIDKDSVVLAMSSGGFDGFIGLATKWLEEKFPKIY